MGLKCLAQGQNDKCFPCQLRDSIQQPFGYWPNTLTTRYSMSLWPKLLGITFLGGCPFLAWAHASQKVSAWLCIEALWLGAKLCVCVCVWMDGLLNQNVAMYSIVDRLAFWSSPGARFSLEGWIVDFAQWESLFWEFRINVVTVSCWRGISQP